MFKSKGSVVAIHIVMWLVFLSLPVLFSSGMSANGDLYAVLSLPKLWLFNISLVSLFYVNTYLLIPRFYLQQKHLAYAISLLLLFAGFYAIKPFERLILDGIRNRDAIMANDLPPGVRPNVPPFPGNRPPSPPRGPRQSPAIDITSIFLFLVIIVLGLAIQITRQWRYSEQRTLKAEAEKATAELSFLKAQINPHFLFNTLNNIFSMAVTQNPNTAASVMRLSNIMRYVTEEATEELVPLDDEIDCIRDFIDLQRLRLGQNITVDFSVSGNTALKMIAPLILITFVENVFKHGLSSHEQTTITIKLLANEQNISFFCQNRIFPGQGKKERTGIGLSNTRQRLEHLYHNRHLLNISTENELYTVQLTLQA
jgi:two-component system LytT family sensor kinase